MKSRLVQDTNRTDWRCWRKMRVQCPLKRVFLEESQQCQNWKRTWELKNTNVLRTQKSLMILVIYCFYCRRNELKDEWEGTSLVVQWLRIRLPMQGIWVRALVRGGPTCRGATKPVCHDCWACVPQLLKPTCLESVLCNMRSPRTATKSSPRSPQLEKAREQQRRPNAYKNK